MSTLVDVIFTFVKNPIDVFEEAGRLLIKIAENILQNPRNPRIRTLQKSNATVSKKILKVPGGKELLLFMGFVENSTYYNLPTDASLQNVAEVKDEILKLMGKKVAVVGECSRSEKSHISNNVNTTSDVNLPHKSVQETFIKKVEAPQYVSMYKNDFLREVEYNFNFASIYSNKYLQERAKSCIPMTWLQNRAMERFHQLQFQIKTRKLEDAALDLCDMLLLELLDWFKSDFFVWVDTLNCEICNSKTVMSHMSTDKNLMLYTDRVEMHKCLACNHLTPFPRYHDLNILLETRRGRCGEFANVFTLLCCAMGWDARYVADKTDHVWTEVYSHSQKRWLHCDPCENVCDKPLMYEVGWNKEVSYVIAYSSEEVQDVTWRYTNQFQQTLQRRKLCTEMELVEAIGKLNSAKHKTLSASRRNFVLRRTLFELVELMVERKSDEADKIGRTSGALSWRLSRNEIIKDQSYIWRIDDDVVISYSSCLDMYKMCDFDNVELDAITGWENGVLSTRGLFRKVESDWNMCYLTRTEGTTEGTISWKFQVNNSEKVIDTISIKFASKTFENGKVLLTMCDDDNKCIKIDNEDEIGCFTGADSVTLSATLTGGKGDVAWQHSQLFRDKIDSSDFQFSIKIKLR